MQYRRRNRPIDPKQALNSAPQRPKKIREVGAPNPGLLPARAPLTFGLSPAAFFGFAAALGWRIYTQRGGGGRMRFSFRILWMRWENLER